MAYIQDTRHTALSDVIVLCLPCLPYRPLNRIEKDGETLLVYHRGIAMPQEYALMRTRSARQFLHETEAATAVEYAVMLGLIVVGTFSVIVGLGTTIKDVFTHLAEADW